MIPKLYCSDCNGEVSVGDRFCSSCGASVDWHLLIPSGESERSEEISKPTPDASQRCPLCGFENLSESRYCENCGAGLQGTREPSELRKAASKDQAKRQKQKPGKRSPKKLPAKGWRVRRYTLETWKVLSASVVVVLVGLAIYNVTNPKQEEHGQNSPSGASTSVLQQIEQLQATVDANPEDSQSLLRLANLLQDARFLPRAIETYKRYLAVVPSDANARVDMGICYFESGDAQTAISEMEKALEFEPRHQLGHLNLGVVNLNSGNLEKANEWFERCVRINPNTEAGKRAQRLLDQHTTIQNPLGQ